MKTEPTSTPTQTPLTAVYSRRKRKSCSTAHETPSSPSSTSKCSTPTKVLCLKNKSSISGSAVVGEVDNRGFSHYCSVSNIVNPSSSSLVATKNEMDYNGKPLSLQFQPGTPSPKKQKRQAKKPTHVFRWPRACHSKKRTAADKFVSITSYSTKPKGLLGPLQNGESNKKGKNVLVDHDDTTLVVSKERPQSKPKRKPIKILNLHMTKEEKEEQPKIYKGLVDSFISRMRHVQGVRPIIPWKGSVMDSVIGAFLTQNVSDTLSSSAFISLAAKFPNTNLQATEGKGSCSGSNSEAKYQMSGCQSNNFVKGFCETTTMDKLKDMEASSLNHEALIRAKVSEIAKAIMVRGQQYYIAKKIKGFLNKMVKEHGSIDLEWLKDTTPDKVKTHLRGIRGLGVKSVECIRLLTLHHSAFPVDTNVARIAVRLGWVTLEHHSENDPLNSRIRNLIQEFLWSRLRNLDLATLYELHCQMITFGKVFCMKKNPNCIQCPMKEECKYYASVASQRSTLPERRGKAVVPPMLPIVAATTGCEPVIEEPTTPKNTYMEMVVPDMEDAFNETGQRTLHVVYELPNKHPLLDGLDERLPDDPCPYLLAIWRPGVTEEPSETCCSWQESGILCQEGRCLPCSSMRKENSKDVEGTLLIPVKTTMRERFPWDGTHFQVNEVFADYTTSTSPISFSRCLAYNLKTRVVYSGTSVSSIYRGMSKDDIKLNFDEGYICLQGYNRNERKTMPLADIWLHPSNNKKHQRVNRRV